jgi:hypothetical protein
MRVVVHHENITAMMLPDGEVGRATMRDAGNVRDRAKRLATVDTGLMRNSIVAELYEQTPRHIIWRIGSSVFYAPFQEKGTGPIHARRAPLLVFKIGNRWVSTYSTRGVPAVRFLARAIEAVTVEDFR